MGEISLPLAVAMSIVSTLVAIGCAWGIMRQTVTALQQDVKRAEDLALKSRDDLAAFQLKASETYVSAAALNRLEGRLEQGFQAIRDEMRDQQSLIVKAITAPRARHAPKDEG
jgi:hypothetical protein